MEGQRSLDNQCPLLRPAVSPVSNKASIVIEPDLDACRDAFEGGHGRRVIDSEGPMTIDVAGICLACHDAVTSARANGLCRMPGYFANCPISGKFKSAVDQMSEYKFPFDLNVPLKPETVVDKIGVREGNAPLELVKNFSRKVLIQTMDDRSIESTLVHVYYDGAALKDGILHFSDRVRGDDWHGVNDKYLTADEIESITFLG